MSAEHSTPCADGRKPAARFPLAEKGILIERTEQVEHHRWTPPEPGARGLAPLDGPTRALLHQLRWREAPPSRGRRWLALGIVLALHVLFAWLTWSEMQSRPSTRSMAAERRDALRVRLIPRPPAPAAPAEVVVPPPVEAPPAPPPAPSRPPLVREAPNPNAMTVTLPSPAPAPAPATSAPSTTQSLRLYDDSGRLLLPSTSSAAPAPAEPGYVQRAPKGDANVMQQKNPVTYQATRFEKDWAPVRGNSSVDDALKRAVDKTTVTHTFHVAPGVRVNCAVTLVALAGGCGVGDPPRQPSGKSGDMRLNMAPAAALVPDTAPPPAPSVEECIAIYRANKPLPQGCPVDTPTRSVDAEMQEHGRQQQSQRGG